MVWILNRDLVGLQSTTIVLSGDKSCIGLIKDEDEATYFFLGQTQLDLCDDLSEVIWLNVVLVGEICYSEDGLRGDSQSFETFGVDIHNFYFALEGVHFDFPLLLLKVGFILDLKHHSAAHLQVISPESHAIDLILIGLVFELELLDAFVLLDYLEFEYFDHVFVVLYRFGFVL